MNAQQVVDAAHLLERVAARVPAPLRTRIVVVGSIATAWAFRDVSGTASVATKDIDLLLRPAVDAVTSAETLGRELLGHGWTPHYPSGWHAGSGNTREEALPALRLRPADDEDHWFVELMAEPPPEQVTRKLWRRLRTDAGDFGLPSFRYMRVAAHDADQTPFGLRVARPACMALAHLLEHAEPDTTPISNLPGQPPRFVKDVGRAIALWWLAREQSPVAHAAWLDAWHSAINALYPRDADVVWTAARQGLTGVSSYLREAHAIAVTSVLAPHGTTAGAYRRAYDDLKALFDQAG